MSYRIAALVGLLAIGGIAHGQALPAKVDLGPEFQKLGIVPRKQGSRDTCSLFALTAVADFECARHTPPPHPRLSEEFLIWAGDEASGLKGDQAMFYKAFHGLNTLGICAEELMPYASESAAKRKPSARAIADAKERSERWKAVWIKRWDTKRHLTEDEIVAIKKALANGHPVACGLRWPKALKGDSLLDVPPPNKVFDGHSIVMTGYEDDANRKGSGVFLFRNSDGPDWGKNGYGVMSYAYAQAYANDALWLHLGPPRSEVPAERFEAESMTVLAREKCETSPQKMEAWGGRMWSRGEQLFCRAEKGGRVTLAFEVRNAGRYRVRVLATAGPDFGTIRIALDGKTHGPNFDLYSGRIGPAGSLELGNHELTAGKHRLSVTAVSKNAVSENFFFGLDAVDLVDVK